MNHRRITMQYTWNMDVYLYLALVLFLYLPGCNAQRDDFDVPPENTYHLVTDANPAIIVCTTRNDSGAGIVRDSWYGCETNNQCQAADGISEENTIYNETKHGLDREEGKYNLEIKDVAFLDAGAYMCQAKRDSTEHKAIAKLLVIGDNPTCEHVAENPVAGDDVTLHCRVTYSGDFKPVMVWTSDSNHAIPDAPMTEGDSDAIHTYDYTFDITLTRQYKEITFTCQTTFMLATEQPPSDQYDENDPDYDHMCETIININIPAENATTSITTEDSEVVSDGHVLNPGDKLVCDDKTANPPPSVTWTQDPGPPVLDGDMLVIQGVENYYITCAASNTIGTGYRAVNISVEAISTTTTSTTTTTTRGTDTTSELVTQSTAAPVTEEEGGGGLEGWAIAIIVVCCLLAILAIVLLIYWFFCRNRKKDSDDHKPSNNTSYPGNQADVVRNTGAADHQNNTEPFQPYGNIYNSDKNPRKKKKVPTATLR